MKTPTLSLMYLSTILGLAIINACGNAADIIPASKKLPVISIRSDIESLFTSSDQKSLAFITKHLENQGQELLMFSISSSRLVGRTSVSNRTLKWSKDSQRIVTTREYQGNQRAIVVMNRNGKFKSYKIKNHASDFDFRLNDSHKILYCIQADGKVQIWEINTVTDKQRKLMDAPKNFAGIMHFKGRDCYAEYTSKNSLADKLFVKAIDSGKAVLTMPFYGLDNEGIDVDFSPNGKWISIHWGISDNSFVVVGNVKDTIRLMRERYVSAYSGTGYRVEWLTGTPTDYAIIHFYDDITQVHLNSGSIDMWKCPLVASWWRSKSDIQMNVVADKKGLRLDRYIQGRFIYGEGSDDPEIRQIARFRKIK